MREFDIILCALYNMAMVNTPSKTELKRWVKELDSEIEVLRKKRQSYQTLLDLEETVDVKPKTRKKRPRNPDTIELEEKVKVIFEGQGYRPIKRGELISAIVSAYEGRLTNDEADGKLLNLKRAGFIVPEKTGKYGFYELASKPEPYRPPENRN